jgi:hypothetical protein
MLGYHVVTSPGVWSLQHLPDLVKRHTQLPEPADDLGYRYLRRLVEPVTRSWVNLGWLEQARVVVVPESFHAHVRHSGEVPDGQPDLHD